MKRLQKLKRAIVLYDLSFALGVVAGVFAVLAILEHNQNLLLVASLLTVVSAVLTFSIQRWVSKKD